MSDKNRKISIIIAAILGCVGLFYLGGMLGQLLGNYAAWMDSGGVSGESTMKPVSWNPLICFPAAFSGNGIKGILMILLIAGAIFAYVKLHDKFDGKQHDPRGFARSKSGIYGTASWMDEKEMKEVLEISPVPAAKGTILGEYNGKAVCMPEDTRLNRHIAIFGASGTMKSRAIIRNALFQALRRSESVIVTDSKGELYADTSEMFRNAGYDVKIYNLVSPEHSDSWNCMSDLNGDTLMAQVLTNVIIGNTSSGKGDHFWDNGEGNLLKALILLIDQDRTRSPDMKHLSAVYQLLTQNSERQLTAMFDKLPLDHPARAPFNLFAQSSDTVRSGIILGLGTRLQVLQNQAVQRITSRSDIDLTAPGRNKCIYYIVLSDQDAMLHCNLSQKEQHRRKEIVEHTRQMLLTELPIDSQDETSIMGRYRDYYLQISFSELHPLMVVCLAKALTQPGTAKQCRIANDLNLRSVLGSHAINDEVGCYSYRATHWLDTELDAKRFYEILDRCVDEADRGFYKLAC